MHGLLNVMTRAAVCSAPGNMYPPTVCLPGSDRGRPVKQQYRLWGDGAQLGSVGQLSYETFNYCTCTRRTFGNFLETYKETIK